MEKIEAPDRKYMKIEGIEFPDAILVNGKQLYLPQSKIITLPLTSEVKPNQEQSLDKLITDTLNENPDYNPTSEDGVLPGQELIDSTGPTLEMRNSIETNIDIQDEDIAGMGYVPNSPFALFKTQGEENLLKQLESLALTFGIPAVEMYYNKQGQELALANYQAVLNYLVAEKYGYKGKALVNAFAARHSLLPKRIRDGNGNHYFPELEHEQSKLKIFSKLHDFLFKGVHDSIGKTVSQPIFVREKSRTNPKVLAYYTIDGDIKTELDKNYTPFLDNLATVIQYVNDDPDDDHLTTDKQANLIEAVDIFSLFVLPSHMQLRDYPDSKNPHTVRQGLDLLNKYGGSYKNIAEIIESICYKHQ